MSDLAAFQSAFADALLDRDTLRAAWPSEVARAARHPAFAVYRNTALKGAIDALAANFPAVTRLVGDEWMRAAATVFVRRHPPATPVLLEYGSGFPEFLRGFPPAGTMPWLATIAELDHWWTEAHVAADAVPLDPAALAGVDGDALGALVLAPHPSARWGWFAEVPACSIWTRNRDLVSESPEAPLAWRGEGIVIVRPRDRVEFLLADQAMCAFLDACAAGASLAEAAGHALASSSDADVPALVAALFAAGVMQHPPALSDRTPELP